MRRLEIWSAGIALAILAFGIALQPLLTPAFTRFLSARYSEVPDAQAAGPAEVTRRFVTGDEGARKELARLMPDAVSHLEDVRSVISGANVVAGLLAALVSVWLGVRVLTRKTATVASALRLGGALAALMVVAVGVLGLTDFDAFFAKFHSLFFAAGTWVFPYDSLLIRLFPERFWVTAAAALGASVLVVAALYVLGGRALARSSTQRPEATAGLDASSDA